MATGILIFPLETHVGKRHKRNEFVLKDFKIGLSCVQGAPENMDVSMGSSWEVTTPTLGWQCYPWATETSLSLGVACSWRNYRMTGKQRFIKDAGSDMYIGSYPEGADIQFSRIKVFSWAVPVMLTHETKNNFNFSLGAIVNFNTHASLKTRYKQDGQEFKLTDSNIHQTPVTIDIQAAIGYYCCPIKILRSYKIRADFICEVSPFSLDFSRQTIKSNHGQKYTF